MIKCPNCGSTAQMRLVDENFDELNNYFDRTYECGCGMGIGTREIIVDTDFNDSEEGD